MKIITNPNVRPGCYLMIVNGQPVHGGEIKDFISAGSSGGMRLEIAVNPVDQDAMRAKIKRRASE